MYIPCEECNGTGEVQCNHYGCYEGKVNCPDCDPEMSGKVDCEDCGGTGFDDDNDLCNTCDGTGKVECELCDGTGEIECDECDGEAGDPCDVCGGSGEIYLPD